MAVPNPLKRNSQRKTNPNHTTESRSESDSLGQMEIPEHALYGIQTARALSCMSFSGVTLASYPDLIVNLAIVKKACALANLDSRMIESEHFVAIGEACDKVIAGWHHDEFVVDMLHGGGSIAFNQNANEVLANLANQILGHGVGEYSPVSREQVNLSQSTADVCHTAFRLAVRGRISALLDALQLLSDSLDEKRAEFADVETLARTCLQDAMPTGMGTTFGAYATFVARRRSHLVTAAKQMDVINLGGTVIGDGSGAHPNYRRIVPEILSNLVGRKLVLNANLFDAAQHIDDLSDISSELRTLAEGLIKLAKDLRLLSSGPNGGFSEIVLPAVMEGSSFFKGKINPVIPESLIQACMLVLGADRVVQSAAEHGELNLNVFDGLAAKSVLDATQLLERAIVMFTENCVNYITVNRERCKQLAILGCGQKQEVKATEEVKISEVRSRTKRRNGQQNDETS